MNLLSLLQQRFHVALTGLVPDPTPYAVLVRACEPKFGDYQFNGVMSIAKALGDPKKARQLAEEIVKRLPPDELFEKIEIAGPGFINLRFRTEWVAAQMGQLAKGDRLGIAPAEKVRTVVIDYSSPNVAKPLHVGHLRSTIIGDSLKRLLRFLGHTVIADNHLGDWGLQFGMLLYGYKNKLHDEAVIQTDPVHEMGRLYVEVRNLIKPVEQDEDEEGKKEEHSPEVIARAKEVREACRLEIAKLHAGDPENRRLWKMFMPWCLDAIKLNVYRPLEVAFDQWLGESFYDTMLPGVVDDLLKKDIARESDGAIAVFFGENEPPALIRKRDGAFTYATSDLATIRYRQEEWQPTVMLYVVDFRQALHFKQLFEIARRWGYNAAEFRHISFGSVLGEDGKPMKAREGGATELDQLLAEAVRHAGTQYDALYKQRVERGEEVPVLAPDELRRVHEAVGYGAVKYADLSQNRESDYTFSWQKMLATEGNTATYMQYAYARCRSIFRKGDEDATVYRTHPPAVYLEKPEERALALQLLRFEEALQVAVDEYRPNGITAYLWDLAKTYSGFFQNCPVLKADTPALRQSRLLLCDLTARTIQKGLDLLGIRTIERM